MGEIGFVIGYFPKKQKQKKKKKKRCVFVLVVHGDCLGCFLIGGGGGVREEKGGEGLLGGREVVGR